jgi:ABC-2 type transport system ATP-binding protein
VNVVECAGLTRDFGRLRAVDELDLTVPQGTVFGFLGPNGAGKTTTIRLLLGLLPATAGSVRVLGHALPGGAPEVRRRSGVVLEHPGLYEGLSVRAALEFYAGAYGLERAAARRRVETVVERLGLEARLDERPQHLSRGLRQRFAVARALLGEPELLVLDEPTNGLDPEAAAGLRREILDLAGGGTTVFLATHLLAEAERMCDHVAIVRRGRVLASDTPAALRRRAPVRAVHVEGPGVGAAWPLARLRLRAPEAGASAQAGGPDALSVPVAGIEAVGEIVRALVESGAVVQRVEPEGQTLEAVFLDLVGEPADAGGDALGAVDLPPQVPA